MLTSTATSPALYGRRQNDQTDYNIVYQRTAAGLKKNAHACSKISLETHNLNSYNPIYTIFDKIQYNVHIRGGSRLKIYMHFDIFLLKNWAGDGQ